MNKVFVMFGHILFMKRVNIWYFMIRKLLAKVKYLILWLSDMLIIMMQILQGI